MRRHISFVFLVAAVLILGGVGCLSNNKSSSSPAGPAGVYVSTDKGESWAKIDALPQAAGVASISGVGVYRFFEDPHDPQSFYLATRQHGMFFTYDDGRSWQQPANGPFRVDFTKGPATFVYSIVVHPVDPCTIFGTDGNKIFKSTDCSRTWEEVYRETRGKTRIISLDIEKEAPYRTFAAQTEGDLLRSDDGGNSWRTVHRFEKDDLKIVAVDPFTHGTMYVATEKRGLWRSIDGGETWETLQEGLEEYSKALDFRRMVFHPTKSGVIYWISTYGIHVTADNGDTWEPMELITEPGSLNIYGFAINPNNDQEIYYTGTLGNTNRSTLYKTLDGGVQWTTKKLPSGQVPIALRVHPEKESWLYLGYTLIPSK